MIRTLLFLLFGFTAFAQVNQFHLRGTTSNVQTQINGKLPLTGGTVTGSMIVTNAPHLRATATNLWLAVDSGGTFRLLTPGTAAGSVEAGFVLRMNDEATGDSEFSPIYVENIAALKGMLTNAAIATGWLIQTLGYYTAGDNGGGTYRYDSVSAATANDGTVIAPTNLPGRFLLLNSHEATLRHFGGKGDGSSNDTTPLQNAVTALNSGVIHKLRIPSGVFVLRDDFILTGENMLLEGDGPDSVLGSAQSDGTNNLLFEIKGTNIVFSKVTVKRLANTNTAQGIADILFDIKNTTRNFTFRNGIIDGGMTNQVTGRTGYYFREFRTSGLTSTGVQAEGVFINDNYFTDTGSRSIDFRGVKNAVICRNRGYFLGMNIPPYAPSTNKPLGTFIEIQSYDTGGQVNWSTNVVINDNIAAIWGDGFINTGGTSDMTIVGNAGASAYAMGLDRDTYLPTSSLGENGISLFGGRRTTIANNTIAYTGQAAFQIRTEESNGIYFKDLEDIVVSGNTAVAGLDQRGDQLESNYSIYAINTNTSLRNIVFSGNVHRNYATVGGALALQMSSGASITGVNITGNSFYGATNVAASHQAISWSSAGSGTASGINIVGNLIGNYDTGLYTATSWPTDTVGAHNRFNNVTTQNNTARTMAFESGNGFISIKGTASGNSAGSGHIRLPNLAQIRFRNAADSGDAVALEMTSGNEVQIGTYLRVVPTTAQIQFSSAGKLIFGSGTQSLAASGTITPSGTAVRISGSGAAVTLGATAISNGDTTGQYLILIGTSDTNTVTVNDGSNTNLADASRTLGLNDILVLLYVSSQGWNEVSFSNN